MGVCALLITFFYLYTSYRYRRIAELSNLLRRIASGDYKVDIYSSTEGELSILESEIYKLTITLREQTELLRKDKTFLSNSISDISHQLKTPITSMTVMCDLLQAENIDSDKRLEFTKNLRSQIERLNWLVSSLLKLSRLDAGAVEFKPVSVNVAQLVREATQHLRIPMEIKDQRLDIEGETDVSIIVDPAWTLEALANVVKNSMEHAPQGGFISINWEKTPLFTRLTVSDNGNGIPDEDLPNLFQRFYKGRNSSRESIGIGLAMAYTILVSQKASIEAGNRSEGGAVFTLKFYDNQK